jgi:hypothetical protein
MKETDPNVAVKLPRLSFEKMADGLSIVAGPTKLFIFTAAKATKTTIGPALR